MNVTFAQVKNLHIFKERSLNIYTLRPWYS